MDAKNQLKAEAFILIFFAIACATSNALMQIASALVLVYGGFLCFSKSHRDALRVFFALNRTFWTLIIGLCLIATFSLIYSHFAGLISDISFPKDISKLRMFGVLFFLSLIMSRNRKITNKAMRIWVVLLAIQGIYALVQHYTGVDLIRSGNRGVLETSFRNDVYHGAGLFNHYLTYASIAILAVPMSFPFFKRNIALVLSLLVGVGVYFSFSRSAWIALICQVILLGFYFLKTKKLRFAFLGTLVGGVICATIINPDILHRFTHFSNVNRLLIWKANINMFLDHPILGVGFLKNEALSDFYVHQISNEAMPFTGHAHNNFLTFLSGTGILGFLTFTAIWVIVLFKSIRRPTLATLAFPIIALLGFHTIGLTQMNFFDSEASYNLVLVLGYWLFRSVDFKVNQEA